MLKSYVIAVTGIAALMVVWAFVQRIWGQVFFPESPEDDALEHRISCGKCGCAAPCDRSKSERDEMGRVSLEDSSSH